MSRLRPETACQKGRSCSLASLHSHHPTSIILPPPALINQLSLLIFFIYVLIYCAVLSSLMIEQVESAQGQTGRGESRARLGRKQCSFGSN